MEKNRKIELSSIQATAYWWINVIKNKVRELVISGTSDKQEIKFVEKFYNYTETDWRNLYLELVKYITEDVNNYVPIGNIMGIDTFNQDTAKKGHDRINEELSKIMHCSIPDIRLASSSSKDSVIYTDMNGAYVWYKSCGTRKLNTIYEPCYILTGNEENLNFYNLLLSIIAVLNEKDRTFNSVELLREGFCKEFKKINKPEESLREIREKFNYFFSRACDTDFIYGSVWASTYFANFRDIDYVGLEQHMDDAEHYANAILQKNKTKAEKAYSKKIKRN